MRTALVLLLGVTACYREATPPVVVASPPQEAPKPAPVAQRKPVEALTPMEVAGAVLGQTYEELKRARPNIREEVEGYDFRDHFVEDINAGGITQAHYYTTKNKGVMYQISLDFDVEGRSEAMWKPYVPLGRVIEDLGGQEVVVNARYPFEVRVWLGETRLQLMAVIEGNEWWDEYYGVNADDDDEDDEAFP